MVCKVTMAEQVPYFNAGIYSSTKTKYGQVDEVFGATNDVVSTECPTLLLVWLAPSPFRLFAALPDSHAPQSPLNIRLDMIFPFRSRFAAVFCAMRERRRSN
jgi:hypothetical protein